MFAAGKGHVRDLREQFEAIAVLSGDGFGQQAARQVRGVHAVAGIGLDVLHVWLIP